MARRKYKPHVPKQKHGTSIKFVKLPCCETGVHMHVPMGVPGCSKVRCYNRIVRTHMNACPYCGAKWKIDPSAYGGKPPSPPTPAPAPAPRCFCPGGDDHRPGCPLGVKSKSKLWVPGQ